MQILLSRGTMSIPTSGLGKRYDGRQDMSINAAAARLVDKS
ncbi:MAG TPA: hypothetical protein P5238_04745 [Smithellaceae bacterium]|nr:hypothetical protein [Smithellaceae bacterium]